MENIIFKSDEKFIKKEMSKNEKLVSKGKNFYKIENINNKDFNKKIVIFAKENNLKVKITNVETFKGLRNKAVFNTNYENCNLMQDKAGKMFWQIGSVSGKMQIINNY